MKKIITTVLALLTSLTLISQNKTTMTYEEQISYCIGYMIGKQMSTDPFKHDVAAAGNGMKAAINNETPVFTEQEMQQMLQEWQQKMQAEQESRATADLDKNKAEGQAFLEKNKQDKDVKVTPSGLQYKVVTMGTGAKPTSSTDRVRVHYEGTLLDGTVFDSSYKRGEDISFGLNQVIQGWTEGVQLMPVGSKFIFYIPSDLAYGDRGSAPVIPAGATLIFTIELFGINE